MSTGPSSATIDNAAPSCQLDAVIATYACSVNVTLLPSCHRSPSRSMRAGIAGGRSVNAGWNPPAEMAKAGLSPMPMRISSEPLNSTPPSFESRSRASMAMRPGLDVVVAEHVGGQLDEPRRVDVERWRRRPDRAEDRQAGEAEVAAAEHAGELGEDGEAGRDDRRRAPVDLDRRSDDEAARLDREDRCAADR